MKELIPQMSFNLLFNKSSFIKKNTPFCQKGLGHQVLPFRKAAIGCLLSFVLEKTKDVIISRILYFLSLTL